MKSGVFQQFLRFNPLLLTPFLLVIYIVATVSLKQYAKMAVIAKMIKTLIAETSQKLSYYCYIETAISGQCPLYNGKIRLTAQLEFCT